MSKTENYQKKITYYECTVDYDNEPYCLGFKSGSHGDCKFKGTGEDYKSCHSKEIVILNSPNEKG